VSERHIEEGNLLHKLAGCVSAAQVGGGLCRLRTLPRIRSNQSNTIWLTSSSHAWTDT
jgi:hypothetical protein